MLSLRAKILLFYIYRPFLPVYYQLAKEPEKTTSIFLQPSGKMTRSPALKVSSLLQLARTSNKTKATRACTPNR